jgi:hypothetical protein
MGISRNIPTRKSRSTGCRIFLTERVSMARSGRCIL